MKSANITFLLIALVSLSLTFTGIPVSFAGSPSNPVPPELLEAPMGSGAPASGGKPGKSSDKASGGETPSGSVGGNEPGPISKPEASGKGQDSGSETEGGDSVIDDLQPLGGPQKPKGPSKKEREQDRKDADKAGKKADEIEDEIDRVKDEIEKARKEGDEETVKKLEEKLKELKKKWALWDRIETRLIERSIGRGGGAAELIGDLFEDLDIDKAGKRRKHKPKKDKEKEKPEEPKKDPEKPKEPKKPELPPDVQANKGDGFDDPFEKDPSGLLAGDHPGGPGRHLVVGAHDTDEQNLHPDGEQALQNYPGYS